MCESEGDRLAVDRHVAEDSRGAVAVAAAADGHSQAEGFGQPAVEALRADLAEGGAAVERVGERAAVARALDPKHRLRPFDVLRRGGQRAARGVLHGGAYRAVEAHLGPLGRHDVQEGRARGRAVGGQQQSGERLVARAGGIEGLDGHGGREVARHLAVDVAEVLAAALELAAGRERQQPALGRGRGCGVAAREGCPAVAQVDAALRLVGIGARVGSRIGLRRDAAVVHLDGSRGVVGELAGAGAGGNDRRQLVGRIDDVVVGGLEVVVGVGCGEPLTVVGLVLDVGQRVGFGGIRRTVLEDVGAGVEEAGKRSFEVRDPAAALLLGREGADVGREPHAVEEVVLDEHHGAVGAAHAVGRDFAEEVVVDVHAAVAHARMARRRGVEVVVVECRRDGRIARGAVRVAHQARLLRLDEVAPRDRHVVRGVRDVARTVLVVLRLVHRLEGAVVDPDVVALLHRDAVGAVVGLGHLDVDVADDDVLGLVEEEADVLHHEALRAVDREVARALDVEPGAAAAAALVAVERTAQVDDRGGHLLVLLAQAQPFAELVPVVEVVDVLRRGRFAAGRARGVAVEAVELDRARHGRHLGRGFFAFAARQLCHDDRARKAAARERDDGRTGCPEVFGHVEEEVVDAQGAGLDAREPRLGARLDRDRVVEVRLDGDGQLLLLGTHLTAFGYGDDALLEGEGRHGRAAVVGREDQHLGVFVDRLGIGREERDHPFRRARGNGLGLHDSRGEHLDLHLAVGARHRVGHLDRRVGRQGAACLCQLDAEARRFRHGDRRAVGEREGDRRLVLRDALEEGVAAFARGLAELLPALPAIGRDPPIALLDLQLRRRARRAGLSRGALGRDAVAFAVGQPLAVDRPVVDAAILFDTDDGRRTVVALVSLVTVGAVRAVVDRDGGSVGEGDAVSRALLLDEGGDALDQGAPLDRVDDRPERDDLVVEFVATLLERFDPVLQISDPRAQRVVVVVAAGGQPHRDGKQHR